jgi:type II secretory pathway predicted ATPase ExeA
MYIDHFGLKQYPFQLVPDPDFLFLSTDHARAKAYLDYAVYNRDGFVVLTGEIGAGKTTLLHKFLAELDPNVLTAKIFQTQLNATEFLQAVLVEFGLNPFRATKVELMDMLNSFLLDRFVEGRQIVLIVDEAQNLPDDALEEIRLLSGLETQKEKILHVVLLGQSELRDRLNRRDMEQMNQRVRLRYHLSALTEEETGRYVSHRVSKASGTDRKLFESDSLPIIYHYSGGIPRLINVLCDTALVCAFAEGETSVSATAVKAAVEEMQWVPHAERQKPGERELLSLAAESQEARLNGADGPWSKAQTMTLLQTLGELSSRLADIDSGLKQVVNVLHERDQSRGKTPLRKI